MKRCIKLITRRFIKNFYIDFESFIKIHPEITPVKDKKGIINLLFSNDINNYTLVIIDYEVIFLEYFLGEEKIVYNKYIDIEDFLIKNIYDYIHHS